MKIRIILLVLASLIILAIASMASGNQGQNPNQSSWGSGNPVMQEDTPGDEETGDGEEADNSGDTPAEEQPAEETPVQETPASDTFTQPAPAGGVDLNLQNALAGIADYDLSKAYDTTKSREENTPAALRALGVVYAGEESPIAKKTAALNNFDMLQTLSGRYEKVQEEFAADPEKDFAPDDPDRTLNYFQPREDPFVIPALIPEELRPELEGTGLDGAVDPALLEQIFWAQYAANLRLIPIIVIGTIQSGPNRGALYTIAGAGFTRWIDEGSSHCLYWGAPFSMTCSQVSEDFVVFTLRGTYDGGCRYAATSPVVRTFHVTR